MSYAFIETTDALRALCNRCQNSPYVAVDTEFHRERTYYAELALIQIATDDEAAIIDPLADIDLAPLYEVMANDKVAKVFHASRQDLEIFFDKTGAIPAPLFDTQVAAALLGYGDQIGYGALVEKCTGTHLRKLHGRTDWMRRPLDKAVLDYAIGDVTHLRDVYKKLHGDLGKKGRLTWLDEEQASLTNKDLYTVPLDDAWQKVKSVHKLKGIGYAIAQDIAAWREAYARKVNRPRRRILSDEAIIDLCRQKPKTMLAIEKMRSVDPGARKKFGPELLAIVQKASGKDRSEWPLVEKRDRPGRFDDALVSALMAILQLASEREHISARLLSARSDLERIAGGDRDVPLLRGWRHELAGRTVEEFLDGGAQLSCKDGRLAFN